MPLAVLVGIGVVAVSIGKVASPTVKGVLPPGAKGTPLAQRTVDGSTVRVYAAPITPLGANVTYVVTNQSGAITQSGAQSVGPDDVTSASGLTVVGRDDGSTLSVEYVGVSASAVQTVRAVLNGQTLDSMTVHTVGGVRFVVLLLPVAARHVRGIGTNVKGRAMAQVALAN